MTHQKQNTLSHLLPFTMYLIFTYQDLILIFGKPAVHQLFILITNTVVQSKPATQTEYNFINQIYFGFGLLRIIIL